MPDDTAATAATATTAAAGLIRAAGVVLWRPGTEEPEVAVVHRPKYDDWSFPKGKLEPGEHPLRAVLRETEEETGLRPALGRPLPPSHYAVGERSKRVDYWAATVAERAHAFVPGDEVDRVEWSPVSAVAGVLSHPGDREVLRAFLAGPPCTTPLIVLRHASAGDKRWWRDDDSLRPLDQAGRADAMVLAGLLAAYRPARLISSVTARCVETLLPAATALDTELTTDRAFTMEAVGPAVDPAASRESIARLAAAGEPVVVCTHGELVPGLVGAVCELLGAEPPADPTLPKGGFWVLHLTDDDARTGTGVAHTATTGARAGSAGVRTGTAPVTGLAATERHTSRH